MLNKTSKTILGIAGLAGVSFAAIATIAGAAPHDRQHNAKFPISIAAAEARAVERFARIDADGSGTVELAEFEAAKLKHRARGHKGKRHSKMRAGGLNHDAQGQRKGGKRWSQDAERTAKRKARRAEMADTMFAILDEDGNDAISRDEFAQTNHRKVRKTAQRRVMFTHLDTNDDGLLVLEEMPNRVDRLRQADTDSDGLITREELQNARKSAVKGS